MKRTLRLTPLEKKILKNVIKGECQRVLLKGTVGRAQSTVNNCIDKVLVPQHYIKVIKGHISVNKRKKRDELTTTPKGMCYAIAFLGLKAHFDRAVQDMEGFDTFLKYSNQIALEIGNMFDDEGNWKHGFEYALNIGMDKGMVSKESGSQSEAGKYFQSLTIDEFKKLMIPELRNKARILTENRLKRHTDASAALLSD